MPQPGRFIPNESTRVRHRLTATVISHVMHTTGRLFWKRRFPSLKVRFSDEEYTKFRQILANVPTGDRGPLGVSPIEVVVGMKDEAQLTEYPVGSTLHILFSTSNGIDAFFSGAALFRWDGVEKVPVQSIAR